MTKQAAKQTANMREWHNSACTATPSDHSRKAPAMSDEQQLPDDVMRDLRVIREWRKSGVCEGGRSVAAGQAIDRLIKLVPEPEWYPTDEAVERYRKAHGLRNDLPPHEDVLAINEVKRLYAAGLIADSLGEWR